ncbi:unnamed protein product [Calypogeia fissa]
MDTQVVFRKENVLVSRKGEDSVDSEADESADDSEADDSADDSEVDKNPEWLDSSPTSVGVRNIEVARAIAAAIPVFGWESVSVHDIDLVKKCALARGEALAELAQQLISMGNVDAGEQVARTMPTFTWCQPHGKLPNYPEVENFLRGPEKCFDIEVSYIAAARRFASTSFNTFQKQSAWLQCHPKPRAARSLFILPHREN